MSYDGEPEKMLPSWTPYFSEPFEYGPKMRLLANRLLENALEVPYREKAIRVLCETAVISDSVECRTALAQIAGIKLSSVDIYKNAVGRNIGTQDSTQVRRVFEMAINAHFQKDYDRYDLLTASVGFYPFGPHELFDNL